MSSQRRLVEHRGLPTGLSILHGFTVYSIILRRGSEQGLSRVILEDLFASLGRCGKVSFMEITAALLASLGTTRSAFDARTNQIVALCSTNDKAVKVACVRLYDHQTADEQRVDTTRHDNGVGFQYMDAKFGGRMARLIKNGHEPFAGNMPRLRRMAIKYRAQLTVLSFLKEQAKVAELCMVLTDAGEWIDMRKAA